MNSLVLLLLVVSSAVTSHEVYIGGLEVRGRAVPILQLLENYASSCTKNDKDPKFGLEQLSEIMNQLNAEEVAKKIYNSLFFSTGDIDIEKLMGKWYTVVDSRLIHKEDCAITYMSLLTKAPYAATFSVVQYSMNGNDTVVSEGYGRMVGPDPGELLITTGHANDQCPYLPIRLGGLKSSGYFDYIILSQPLKFPTMVLARNPLEFERKYKKEAYEFLEKFGFISPVAAINSRLHFVNSTLCHDWRLSFEHLP
ncbi:hypothetical protein PMAYCL1PPCAC_31869, partial [Pristionchus mayeri]